MLADGIGSDMSFTVGGALLLGCLILPVLLLMRFAPDKAEKSALFCLAFGGLSMWMATAYFPWYPLSRILPPLGAYVQTMQFNWRFQAITGVCLAAAAVLGLRALRRFDKKAFAVSGCILCCAALITSSFLFHDVYETKDACFYREMSDMQQGTDHSAFARLKVQISMGEYLPAESDPETIWFAASPRYNADALTVTDYRKSGLHIAFTAQNLTSEPQPITLPLTGYKDYRAYANGEALPTMRAVGGQLQLELPAGFSGSVTVKFTEPFHWRAAEIISLACILCGAVVQLISRNRTKHKKVDSVLSEVAAS